LAFLAARFSLMDFPDFCESCCRGDLSLIMLQSQLSSRSDLTGPKPVPSS
jgi:hypothetical protein